MEAWKISWFEVFLSWEKCDWTTYSACSSNLKSESETTLRGSCVQVRLGCLVWVWMKGMLWTKLNQFSILFLFNWKCNEDKMRQVIVTPEGRQGTVCQPWKALFPLRNRWLTHCHAAALVLWCIYLSSQFFPEPAKVPHGVQSLEWRPCEVVGFVLDTFLGVG